MYCLPCIVLVFLLALTARVTTKEMVHTYEGYVGKPGVINCTALADEAGEIITVLRIEWRGLFLEWKKRETASRNLTSGLSGTGKFAEDDTWAIGIMCVAEVKCTDHQQHYRCQGKFKSESDLPGKSPWEMASGVFEGAVLPEIELVSILPPLIAKNQGLKAGAQVEITYRVVLGFTGEEASVLWRINKKGKALPIADEDPRISTEKKEIPGKECIVAVVTTFKFAASDKYHNSFLEVFVLNSKQGLHYPQISEACDPEKTTCALTPVITMFMCEAGTWGPACSQSCDPECNNDCDQETGECLIDKPIKYYEIVVPVTLVFLILGFGAYFVIKKKKNGQLFFFSR